MQSRARIAASSGKIVCEPTIGPRAGVVAGWSLIGAYFAFTITTSMTAGIFGANFLQAIGLWDTTPTIAPWLIAISSVVICLLMALSPGKTSMRTLLWVEGVWVARRGIWYVSAAHTHADVTETVDRVKAAIKAFIRTER